MAVIFDDTVSEYVVDPNVGSDKNIVEALLAIANELRGLRNDLEGRLERIEDAVNHIGPIETYESRR